MIDIAIVTTVVIPRKTPRPNGNQDPEVRKGSIWVRRKDTVRRRCLECLTPAGVRLELEAFFERFAGKSFRLQIIQPMRADATIAPAISGLVPAPVFSVQHSWFQFQSKKRGTPFDYGFVGRAHHDFAPPWSVPVEPMVLLKSSAGDHYTYPSTDDDEAEETTHVKNGRLGGLKKHANRKKDTSNG